MFHDRTEAGAQLAARLKGRELHKPLVLAIPRGGIVIGAALAKELAAEMDVVIARKLSAPERPEFALGAVDESGEIYLNPEIPSSLAGLQDFILEERARQMTEITRRARQYRRIRPQASVAGRSVLLTDDGIATGSTMIAAIHIAKARKAREVIVAVPVAAPETLQRIRPLCDDVICLLAPHSFYAVGQFYEDFRQVDDDEVARLLRSFRPGRRQRTKS